MLTVEEQQFVLARALQTDHLPVLLALHTGMRLGKICALKWSDVDFERGMITVSSTVQRVRLSAQESLRHKTAPLVSNPKSMRSFRSIPMNTILLQALRQRAEKASANTFVLTSANYPLAPVASKDNSNNPPRLSVWLICIFTHCGIALLPA